MIPTPASVATDPIAAAFRALVAPVDGSRLPQRAPETSGPQPVPATVYLKALLVKIDKHLPSIEALRRYLADHPALCWEIGFRPHGEWPSLPSSRWLRTQQQRLGPLMAQVLEQTVRIVSQAVPALDTLVALDATHHLAWVKHNNPNQSVTHRFDARQQPAGDRDCRLGAKTVHPGPDLARKLAFWGYHSAVMTTETSSGPIVLGATVGPVVAQEVTLARPLTTQVQAVLGHPPTGLTADAAFDAGWLWEWVVAAGGTVAIAHNPRTGAPRRSPDGHPVCAQGHVMRPTSQGVTATGPIQHYGCPLARNPAATCRDPRFRRKGCHKQISTAPGALARVTVDRTSAAYQATYAKRTMVERVFSRIKSWGLDRPRARGLASVTTIVLAGYVLLNLHTLNRLTMTASVQE
jgi:hypothetical protein